MKFDKENPTPLTKVETVALWHAVNYYSDVVAIMRQEARSGLHNSDDDLAVLENESKRLKDAKRALRKVNYLRKGKRI